METINFLLGLLLMFQTDYVENKMEKITYLAIGDSYTIGEGVAPEDNYPNQLAALLRQNGFALDEPAIVAKTGWTTDELEAGIASAGIVGKQYDLVTVLIGVNNQYRGRELSEYQQQLRGLLETAIVFAKGKKENVLVISIPDWGVTPFAVQKGVDQAKVAEEINRFNAVKAETAASLGLDYLDITTHYRERGAHMVVSDQLHPSKEIYSYWAQAAMNFKFDQLSSRK